MVGDDRVEVTEGGCRRGHQLRRRVGIGEVERQVLSPYALVAQLVQQGLGRSVVCAPRLFRVVRRPRVQEDGSAFTSEPPRQTGADAGPTADVP